MRLALVAAALCATAAAAHAQSTRYPPPPPDPDAEAEARSSFWDNALEPGLGAWREKLERARRLIETHDHEPLAEAIELLIEANELAPQRALGWWYLGVAKEAQEDWAGCADAYAQAWKLDPALDPKPPLRARPQLEHALGVCLARAGKLDDARAHLAHLAQQADADSEIWLRLGEADMALGRLADAIDALGRAAEQAPINADVHWALAVAYDRARRDADAEDELATALRLDPGLVRVAAPQTPYLDEAEALYYQGLAAQAAGQPERALVQLRAYQALAPRSPWAARAAQHAGDLATTDWATRLDLQGTAAIDRAKATALLRKAWPDVAACVKGQPGLLIKVTVTTLGPTSTAAPVLGLKGGPRATALLTGGAPDDKVAQAVSCVETATERIPFPSPTQPNSFARIGFPVVSR